MLCGQGVMPQNKHQLTPNNTDDVAELAYATSEVSSHFHGDGTMDEINPVRMTLNWDSTTVAT